MYMRILVDAIAKSGCDAIVMGTHGRKGVGRLLLGSDAQWAVNASPAPVRLERLAPAPG